jgi:hypothetical protein
MNPRFLIALVAFAVLLSPSAAQAADASQNVQLVGSNPLFNRGLNAAATIYKNFLYVGNRTDGSSRCGRNDPRRTAPPPNGIDTCTHPHPGILILDIKDPSNPTIVGEIPAPLNTSGKPIGITSREARV